MSFDHSGRIARLQALMLDHEIDVTLLSVGADLPYFTGYEATPSERLTVAVIPSTGPASLFVPALEAPRVKEGPFQLRPWEEVEDPVALACSTVSEPKRAAVGDRMWSVFLTRFQTEWSHSSWVPASSLTARLRVLKDAVEIEALRQAAGAIDRVMGRIPDEVEFTGRTERDVMRVLADLTVDEGHDSADFTIVAAGPNGASPHHHPGDRAIKDGDVVVCDFGGRKERYFSDSTRTFVVGGEPTDEQVEVHSVVLEANQAGHRTAEAGRTCAEVDHVVRAVVEEAGYGENFVHRTGHGIGLEVHEEPYLVAGNDQQLLPGMTFSIEPGIYLSDELGVRIEDIVVCTEDGARSLNRADRSLTAVA